MEAKNNSIYKTQKLEVKMEADRAIIGSFGQLEIIELAQD